MTIGAETDPLAVHLDAYEEAWRTEHEEVKHALWAYEDRLAVGLGLFEVIHTRYWTWRDRVISGDEEYTPEDERSLRERFVSWLRPCEQVLLRLQALEQQYGTVEGGSEFRRKCREAALILKTWEPLVSVEEEARVPTDSPRLRVTAHAVRALSLEQDAAELDRVARPSAESVPLKHKPDYSKVF